MIVEDELVLYCLGALSIRKLIYMDGYILEFPDLPANKRKWPVPEAFKNKSTKDLLVILDECHWIAQIPGIDYKKYNKKMEQDILTTLQNYLDEGQDAIWEERDRIEEQEGLLGYY